MHFASFVADNKGCWHPIMCFVVGSCNGQLILLFHTCIAGDNSNQFAYNGLVEICSVVLVVNFQGIPCDKTLFTYKRKENQGANKLACQRIQGGEMYLYLSFSLIINPTDTNQGQETNSSSAA